MSGDAKPLLAKQIEGLLQSMGVYFPDSFSRKVPARARGYIHPLTKIHRQAESYEPQVVAQLMEIAHRSKHPERKITKRCNPN